HPEERLAFQLADSGARVLLTRRGAVADLAAGMGIRCVFPHEDPEGDGPSADLPPPVLLPENLAYVIYTSGSTGRPKGVEVSHAALANLCTLHGALYGVAAADRATLVAGVGFDATVWEIWPYLAAGASLHVVEEGLRGAPEELREWFLDRGITLSWLPVLLAEGLLALPWPPRPALRALLTGGERLAPRAAGGAPTSPYSSSTAISRRSRAGWPGSSSSAAPAWRAATCAAPI